MTDQVNIGDAYSVAPLHPGLVRLELIVKTAEFPAFALVMPAATAARIGEALLANAAYSLQRSAAADQAGGASHGA